MFLSTIHPLFYTYKDLEGSYFKDEFFRSLLSGCNYELFILAFLGVIFHWLHKHLYMFSHNPLKSELYLIQDPSLLLILGIFI